MLAECVGVPALPALPSVVAPDWKSASTPALGSSVFCVFRRIGRRVGPSPWSKAARIASVSTTRSNI